MSCWCCSGDGSRIWNSCDQCPEFEVVNRLSHDKITLLLVFVLCRTTCALTVVAAAVAASIPAAAAKIPDEDLSDDFDRGAESPTGSSGNSSTGAWLLGDEEAGLHTDKPYVCKVHGKRHLHPAGSYQPPGLQDHSDVLAGKDDACVDERMVVVVDSPASDDTESVSSSDQLHTRDQVSPR